MIFFMEENQKISWKEEKVMTVCMVMTAMIRSQVVRGLTILTAETVLILLNS